MTINITKFPKFILSSRSLPGSWANTLHLTGCPSAIRVGECLYELDDVEYTYFVLRWS